MRSSKGSYLDYYKDPRWQKKRLEVMERDGFRCRECDSETETLNVHHCYYENGKKPWEYYNFSLVTLCDGCHEGEKEDIKEAKRGLLEILSFYGFTSGLVGDLAGIIQEVAASGNSAEMIIHLLREWETKLNKRGAASSG